MSGLRGLVKIRKDGEPRLTTRRQEGGGRRWQTVETALIATIVVRTSCGDEDDRGDGRGGRGRGRG